jgi:hypothetical protein
MKKQTILKLVALAALLLLFFLGCTLPAYRMSFTIDSASDTGNYVDIGYTLENIGEEPLDNARIRVSVWEGSTERAAWTSGSNLSVGESVSGTISIYCPSWDGVWPEVIAAGWDTDD